MAKRVEPTERWIAREEYTQETGGRGRDGQLGVKAHRKAHRHREDRCRAEIRASGDERRRAYTNAKLHVYAAWMECSEDA